MDEIEYYLIEILKASIQKNGNVPLTTQHLLNILKLARKNLDRATKENDLLTFDQNWE